MKRSIALRLLVPAFVSFFFLPSIVYGADATVVPDSTNKVLKLTDSGIEPQKLVLGPGGSSVFFLNTSNESLVNVEVDYGTKPGYCATGKMKMEEGGRLRSKDPVAPKQFVTVCFPHSGTYPVKIYGLKGNPQGASGTVIVQ